MPSRLRDKISQPPSMDYFHQRLSEGWTITAIEWSRAVGSGEAAASAVDEEVPYGLRIADDCSGLAEQAMEMEVVAIVYDGIIAGVRPSNLAGELNKREYRTRTGMPWTAAAVYDLMPRIIELSPRLQRRPDWPRHRAELHVVA